MKVFGKPVNRWGWMRVIAYTALAGIVTWALAAAGLRQLGAVSWMAWSGYQTFSPLAALDLAVVSLLAAFAAGWLEVHEQQTGIALAQHQEAGLARAVQREAIIGRFQQAVQAALPGAGQAPAGLPERTQIEIALLAREALKELDGQGKGAVLRFLFDQKLLDIQNLPVELHNADCRGAVLTDAQLGGICLDGVDLSNAQLNGAGLVKGRFFRANLRLARLRQADLGEAVLDGCNLHGARLDDANLEGADLRRAHLEAAILIQANLKDCKLDGYPARGARSTDMQRKDGQALSLGPLDKAILIDTILPDGQKVTNENGKNYLRDKELSMLVDKL